MDHHLRIGEAAKAVKVTLQLNDQPACQLCLIHNAAKGVAGLAEIVSSFGANRNERGVVRRPASEWVGVTHASCRSNCAAIKIACFTRALCIALNGLGDSRRTKSPSEGTSLLKRTAGELFSYSSIGFVIETLENSAIGHGGMADAQTHRQERLTRAHT